MNPEDPANLRRDESTLVVVWEPHVCKGRSPELNRGGSTRHRQVKAPPPRILEKVDRRRSRTDCGPAVRPAQGSAWTHFNDEVKAALGKPGQEPGVAPVGRPGGHYNAVLSRSRAVNHLQGECRFTTVLGALLQRADPVGALGENLAACSADAVQANGDPRHAVRSGHSGDPPPLRARGVVLDKENLAPGDREDFRMIQENGADCRGTHVSLRSLSRDAS